MTIVDRIEAFLKKPPVDEDGEPFGTKLLKPLSEEELLRIEREIGAPMEKGTRCLLSHCAGFEDGLMELVEFWSSEKMGYGSFENKMRQIAADGFGNFWFYWDGRVDGRLGPIYYYQHEGPMIFYQSTDLVSFVDEYLRFMTPPYESLIDDVHEFRLKPLPALNNDLIPRSFALSGSDKVLRDFATEAPVESFLYDFRSSKAGDGIDLQKMGIAAVHPKLPILAVVKKAGFWTKLFKKS